MNEVPEDTLRKLTFFVITPDDRKIPIESVCDDPARNVLRIFGRAVVVVQAVQPDGSEYWKQAFYMSSGRNSEMPGKWLPFDGIVESSRLSIGYYFNKTPYVNDFPPQRNPSLIMMGILPPPSPRATVLNKTGLLEGDVLEPGSPNDRLGSTSHKFAHLAFKTDACTSKLLEGPDAKPTDINTYINKHEATSIHRFRKLGIQIPEKLTHDTAESIYADLTTMLAEFEKTRDPTSVNTTLTYYVGGRKKRSRTKKQKKLRRKLSRRRKQ